MPAICPECSGAVRARPTLTGAVMKCNVCGWTEEEP